MEAEKRARLLVIDQNVGSVAKILSLHSQGKFGPKLKAVDMDEDDIYFIITRLSTSSTTAQQPQVSLPKI